MKTLNTDTGNTMPVCLNCWKYYLWNFRIGLLWIHKASIRYICQYWEKNEGAYKLPIRWPQADILLPLYTTSDSNTAGCFTTLELSCWQRAGNSHYTYLFYWIFCCIFCIYLFCVVFFLISCLIFKYRLIFNLQQMAKQSIVHFYLLTYKPANYFVQNLIKVT